MLPNGPTQVVLFLSVVTIVLFLTMMTAAHPTISQLQSMPLSLPTKTVTISSIPLLTLAKQIRKSPSHLICYTEDLATDQSKLLVLPKMLTYGKMPLSKCLKRNSVGIAISPSPEKLPEENLHYPMTRTSPLDLA